MVPSFVLKWLSFLLCVLAVLCVLVGCSPKPSPKPVAASAETPPPVQEAVSYLADDKNVHGYLCRPGGVGRFPAVVLIHDSMGLTAAMKDAAFRLAGQEYVVLAVDLYRGRVPKDIKDAERQQSELPKERVLGDLKAAVDYLCERDEVRPEQVVEQQKHSHVLGVIGLGMGGSYAMEAALHDSRLRALVLCYCPLPAEAKRLETLKATVFGIFAGKDKSVPAEMIARFTEAINEADKHLYSLRREVGAKGDVSLSLKEGNKHLYAIRVYGESPHGFLDSAYWPIYGKPPEENVAEAWELVARFLDRILM